MTEEAGKVPVGDRNLIFLPRLVPGVNNAVRVACADTFTAVVEDNGQITTWGIGSDRKYWRQVCRCNTGRRGVDV